MSWCSIIDGCRLEMLQMTCAGRRQGRGESCTVTPPIPSKKLPTAKALISPQFIPSTTKLACAAIMFRLARTTYGAATRAAVRVSVRLMQEVGYRLSTDTQAGCTHAELDAAAPEPQHSRIPVDEPFAISMDCSQAAGWGIQTTNARSMALAHRKAKSRRMEKRQCRLRRT